MIKNEKKFLIGLALVIIGVIIGIYVGGWLMFIGGIVQIIKAIKNDLNAIKIALGLLRVALTYFAGFVSAMILILPGFNMMNEGYKELSK